MTTLTEVEKAEFIEEVRRAVSRNETPEQLAEAVCKRLSKIMHSRSAKPASSWLVSPVEFMACLHVDQLQRESADEITIDYWLPALLVGMFSLTGAAEPGGLSELQGFTLGFGLTFMGLLGLELWAGHRGILP